MAQMALLEAHTAHTTHTTHTAHVTTWHTATSWLVIGQFANRDFCGQQQAGD
jgi:hypothetical protein